MHVLDEYGYQITKREAAKRERLKREAENFSARFPIGTRVKYVKILTGTVADDEWIYSTITSPAWVLGHHSVVVNMEHERCFHTTHIRKA